MKTIKNTFFILIIIITGLTSCKKEESKDVSQDKIYADYELFYDKNQDKTYAIAFFKFSNVAGTQLQLTAPSEIKFNSDVLPFDPVFSYYRKEYSGLVTTGTFSFKDVNGTVYTNNASLAKILTNPTIDTIKRNSAFTYTWIGDSVKVNESVGLVIGNNANALNYQFFLQNAINSKNLVLPLTQLNILPIGMSYCQLDRQIESVATGTTSAGGIVRGKYRALNKNLYIK
jgi:hypothetical protein